MAGSTLLPVYAIETKRATIFSLFYSMQGAANAAPIFLCAYGETSLFRKGAADAARNFYTMTMRIKFQRSEGRGVRALVFL